MVPEYIERAKDYLIPIASLHIINKGQGQEATSKHAAATEAQRAQLTVLGIKGEEACINNNLQAKEVTSERNPIAVLIMQLIELSLRFDGGLC
ncbi:hypothetical protein SLE2022_120430 [Rubroshorea leprosula]